MPWALVIDNVQFQHEKISILPSQKVFCNAPPSPGQEILVFQKEGYLTWKLRQLLACCKISISAGHLCCLVESLIADSTTNDCLDRYPQRVDCGTSHVLCSSTRRGCDENVAKTVFTNGFFSNFLQKEGFSRARLAREKTVATICQL